MWARCRGAGVRSSQSSRNGVATVEILETDKELELFCLTALSVLGLRPANCRARKAVGCLARVVVVGLVVWLFAWTVVEVIAEHDYLPR